MDHLENRFLCMYSHIKSNLVTVMNARSFVPRLYKSMLYQIHPEDFSRVDSHHDSGLNNFVTLWQSLYSIYFGVSIHITRRRKESNVRIGSRRDYSIQVDANTGSII